MQKEEIERQWLKVLPEANEQAHIWAPIVCLKRNPLYFSKAANSLSTYSNKTEDINNAFP